MLTRSLAAAVMISRATESALCGVEYDFGQAGEPLAGHFRSVDAVDQ